MARAQFNRNVHGLRGVSIILVFAHHVYAGALTQGFFPLGAEHLLSRGLDAAQYGVELFFIISGFLIADSVLRHRDALTFMRDRGIRIYPAFLVVVSALALAGSLAGLPFFQENAAETLPLLLAANILFLPGLVPIPILLGVAWSLSYEWGFYLFAAAARALRAHLPKAAPIFVAMAAAALIWLYPRASFFAVGTLVFLRHGVAGPPQNEAARRSVLSPLGLPLLLTGLAVWSAGCIQGGIGAGPGLGAERMSGWLPLGVCLGFVGFDLVARDRPEGARFLRSRVVQFLGTISYSLYLWHTLVMFATKRWAAGAFAETSETLAVAVFALSSTAVSVPLAWLSYEVLERRAGNWLKRRGSPALTAPAAE